MKKCGPLFLFWNNKVNSPLAGVFMLGNSWHLLWAMPALIIFMVLNILFQPVFRLESMVVNRKRRQHE